MIFTQEHKIVNAYPAKDATGTTITTDIISLKHYDHITFIWTFGAVGASLATTQNLIAYKGENVTTCATAFAAQYRAEVTSGGDTLEALTALANTGVGFGTGKTLDVTSDNAIIVVEIDAEDLEPTVANPYDTVKMDAIVNSNECLVSCVAILSKGRYQDDAQPTAITD